MGLEVEYDEDVELECPHCKKKSIVHVSGTVEVEPPDVDGPDY
jgi:hypothetical protein